MHKNEKQRQRKLNTINLKIIRFLCADFPGTPWHMLPVQVCSPGKCAPLSGVNGVSIFANFAPHMSPVFWGASESSGVSKTKTNRFQLVLLLLTIYELLITGFLPECLITYHCFSLPLNHLTPVHPFDTLTLSYKTEGGTTIW